MDKYNVALFAPTVIYQTLLTFCLPTGSSKTLTKEDHEFDNSSQPSKGGPRPVKKMKSIKRAWREEDRDTSSQPRKGI